MLRGTQKVDSQSYPFIQEFDLAGQLKAIEHPSPAARRINYSYNPLGQITSVFDGAGKVYAGGIEYEPYGAMKKVILGNGLTERMTPNSRLQPLSIQLGDTAVDDVGAFVYGYAGGTCVSGQTWANNGNVVSQTIKAGATTFTQSYGYDGMNRLKCVDEMAWKQIYDYDAYGNRWLTTNTLPEISPLTPTVKSQFNAANNRLIIAPTGNQYDGVGNLTRLAGGTSPANQSHDLKYDGESRVVESNNQGSVTAYVYDGFGRRVKVGSRVFVYAPGGELALELGGTSEPGTRYLTADHLGSTRIVTQQDKTAKRFDYAPFGEDLGVGTGSRTVELGYSAMSNGVANADPWQRFTGKERDAETGLDYFGARYMSSTMGRFISPDAPLADQHVDDPQSWNLFSYVRNNPLNHTDPSGRCLLSPDVNCFDFLVGAAKEVVNTVPAAATLVNRTIKCCRRYKLAGRSSPTAC